MVIKFKLDLNNPKYKMRRFNNCDIINIKRGVELIERRREKEAINILLSLTNKLY